MSKPRLSEKQRNALSECRTAGRLVKRRDGFATGPSGFGAHGFTTVHSLVDRGLLVSCVGGGKFGFMGSAAQRWVELTTAGREALS